MATTSKQVIVRSTCNNSRVHGTSNAWAIPIDKTIDSSGDMFATAARLSGTRAMMVVGRG